jgi:putative ABC transport system substrate-binding protein
MIGRRDFITLLGGAAAAWPMAAHAQHPERVPRIGYLSPTSAVARGRNEAFRQGLRELGYVEGKNIVIEYRFAEGNFDLLPDLAAELVGLKVDVIVAEVTQASLAAKGATRTIPVVMSGVSDPVGSGLIASLARPGANVTGTSGMSAEVVGKSLEMLKETVPKLSRVAVLWNPDNSIFQAQILRETQVAAGVLGVELRTFGARGADEFDQTFAAITRARARAGALLVLPDPIFVLHHERIVDFAAKSRLPAMYGARENVAGGGLMAYGPSYPELYRRAAAYVDKILKGANPADLPVEQPTKFELVVNLKAAKELGLELPASLLARADEVIE